MQRWNERETTTRIGGALVTAALFCACQPQPFEGRFTRSRFFEYHDRESSPICDALLPMLDEHAILLGSTLGYSPGAGDPFRYYKFRSDSELKASGDCPDEAAGCELGREILSADPFDTHELAHAYTFAAWGGPFSGLFSEGAAVALSCRPAARYEFDGTAPDWRMLLSLRGEAPNAGESQFADYARTVHVYAAAGAFITSLVQRYGWPRVAELYLRVPPGAAALDFEREFARQFPASLDDEWARAVGSGDAAACVRDARCDLEPQAAGERLGAPCVGAQRPIDLIANRVARLSFVGTGITLQSCSDATQSYWFAGSDTADAPTTHVVELPSARYLVNFDRDLPASDVALEDYLSASLAENCGASEPLQLAAAGLTFLDLPAGISTGFLELSGPSKSYAVAPYPSILAGTVELCDQCGAKANCTTLPVGQSTTVTLSAGAALKLERIISLDPAQLRFTPLAD